MPRSPGRNRRRWLAERLPAIVLGVSALGVVAWLFLITTGMRPTQDDYCIAYEAREGFIAGVDHWYSAWAGDLLTVSANVLFVGLPLVHLPWSLASAVTFLSAALLGAGSVTLLWIWGTRESARSWSWVVLLPYAAAMWLAFWWVPSTGAGTNDEQLLAFYSVTWQNINAAYVVTTLACFLIAFGSYLISMRKEKWPLLLTVFGGILVGLAYPALAVTALSVALLAFLVTLASTRVRPSRRSLTALLFALGVGAGLLIAYASPGRRARAAVLADNAPLSDMSLTGLLSWTFSESTDAWIAMAAGASSVLAFSGAAALALVLSTMGPRLRVRSLAALGAVTLAASLMSAVLVRASEAVSYVGGWHQAGTRTLIFVAVFSLGLAAGGWLATTIPMAVARFVGAVGAVALVAFLAFAVVQPMSNFVTDRTVVWEQGAAPVGELGDLDSDWVRQCWNSLGRVRDIPTR